jgi:hypothetical protein
MMGFVSSGSAVRQSELLHGYLIHIHFLRTNLGRVTDYILFVHDN